MDKLVSLWQSVRKHKYLVTLLAFVVIIVFLDENNALRRLGLAAEERRLRGEIERYQQEFDECTERLNELDADSAALERIARERYMMKKPDEDIFVFEEDLKKQD